MSGWENMQWRRRGVAVGKEGSGQRQDTREKISRVVHDMYHWALHTVKNIQLVCSIVYFWRKDLSLLSLAPH